MTRVSSDWERGYDAGYRAALGTARRDIGADFGTPARKKTGSIIRVRRKKDPKMAKALKAANKKGRTSNGKLRKGWDQAKIMRTAHNLKRKM